MRRHVQLDEIVSAGNDVLQGSIYVSQLASVLSYDPVGKTCSCQPSLADVRYDPDTGQPFAEPWPVLYNVPVMWPSGGGTVLAFGLKAGDSVNLIAWDFDPRGIVTSPGSQTVMPVDVRKLEGHAWRAVPETFFPLPAAEAAAAAAGGVLGIIGDPAQVRFVPGTIQLGAQAAQYVALANLVAVELGKVKAALAALAVTVPSGGGTNIPVVSTAPYTTVGPVAATVAKAQ